MHNTWETRCDICDLINNDHDTLVMAEAWLSSFDNTVLRFEKWHL